MPSDVASAPGAGDEGVLTHAREAGEDESRDIAGSCGRSRPAREESGLAPVGCTQARDLRAPCAARCSHCGAPSYAPSHA